MARMTYAIEQRLRFIDFLLAQYGTINRAALTDYFGISTPQASTDLSAYSKLAPKNMTYDYASKAYVATEKFKRAYP